MDTAEGLAQRLAIDQNLSRALNNPSAGSRFLSLSDSDGTAELVDGYRVRHVQEWVDISLEIIQGNLDLLWEERGLNEVEPLGNPNNLGVVGGLDSFTELRSHLR